MHVIFFACTSSSQQKVQRPRNVGRVDAAPRRAAPRETARGGTGDAKRRVGSHSAPRRRSSVACITLAARPLTLTTSIGVYTTPAAACATIPAPTYDAVAPTNDSGMSALEVSYPPKYAPDAKGTPVMTAPNPR